MANELTLSAPIESLKPDDCRYTVTRASRSRNLGQRRTGIAHHFLVGKVLASCLCDTAGIATDRPLVYGERQGITQPASASNIPIPRANPAQRCGVRCVEDDPSRRTPERSSDDYHPPDRSSEDGNAVFDFPA